MRLFSISKSYKKERYKKDLRVISFLEELFPISLNDNLEKVIKTIDEIKEYFDGFKPFNSKQSVLLKEYEIRFYCDTNMMVGNKITYEEAESIIKYNKTFAGKSLNDHIDILRQKEAFNFLRESLEEGVDIDEGFVKKIAFMILSGSNLKDAGEYRDKDVFLPGSDYQPPKPEEILESLDKCIKYYQENKEKEHPVILASKVHYFLASIHPFKDGNGRVARLVMNYILMQNGYPIVNIWGDMENKIKYFNALDSVHSQGDSQFLLYLARIAYTCSIQQLLLLAREGRNYENKLYGRMSEVLGVRSKQDFINNLK